MATPLRRNATFTLVLAFAVAPALRGAMPTLDQLLSLESVSRPTPSPDGRFVCYDVTETDWKENAYVSHLWLADTQTGRSFPLTRGRKSSDGAQWSPDGRWIAFLTERESSTVAPLDEKTEAKEEKKAGKKDGKKDEAKPEARQIWLISPTGGEAWQLTRHGAKIDSFRWSPDGTRLAVVAPAPESKAAKERKERYSEYEVFEEDFSQNHLWLADVAGAEKSGQPAELRPVVTDPGANVRDAAWSPDGMRIAFGATSRPLLSFGGTSDIYFVDLAHGNAVHKVVALDGPDTSPRFSPDGTRLAFGTSLAQPYFFYANDHIASVNVEDVLKKPATKPEDVVDLTPKFDENAYLLDWTKAGILFRARQRVHAALFRLDPATASIARVTPESLFLGDAGLSRDGAVLAFTASDAKSVPEVFVARTAADGFAPKKLTDMNAQVAGFTLGTVELVSWKSRDGATIEGVLHKPADYDSSRKYPLLVVIHGGPTGVSRPVRPAAKRTTRSSSSSRRERSSSSRTTAAAPATAARFVRSTYATSASATCGTS